jgi:hypothetical protein
MHEGIKGKQMKMKKTEKITSRSKKLGTVNEKLTNAGMEFEEALRGFFNVRKLYEKMQKKLGLFAKHSVGVLRLYQCSSLRVVSD